MGYYSEINHSFEDWKNNYPRKVSYNPIPNFKFPTSSPPIKPPTPLETTFIPETTMETVTKIIKELITPSFSSPNQGSMTESNPVTAVTENPILNATVTDFVGVTSNPILNEATTSNNTGIITGIMETVTPITDLMQNSTMPIDAAQNGTNGGSILNTISEIASSTVANTASIVTNATENAITFLNNTTTTESSIHDHGHESHYHYGMRPQRLLYVILFVIIAILILIGVVLLLIYIRYRKNSFRFLQNYYEVSPMKERTPSEHGRDEQKECPPEIYMHYHG